MRTYFWELYKWEQLVQSLTGRKFNFLFKDTLKHGTFFVVKRHIKQISSGTFCLKTHQTNFTWHFFGPTVTCKEGFVCVGGGLPSVQFIHLKMQSSGYTFILNTFALWRKQRKIQTRTSILIYFQLTVLRPSGRCSVFTWGLVGEAPLRCVWLYLVRQMVIFDYIWFGRWWYLVIE